jgi:hypothetical protein
VTITLHAITFLLFLTFIIGLGRAILFLIDADKSREDFTGWMPAAFLFGAAAITLTSLPLSMLGIKTQGWMLIIPAVITATMSVRSPRTAAVQSSTPFIEIIMFGAFMLLLTTNFLVAITYPYFDIDMIGHIMMKGKIIADSSYATAFYFHDPVFASASNNYPPLTVFLQGFMIQLGLGGIADYQAINYFIVLLMAMAFYNALTPYTGKAQAFAWCFILISTAEYLRNQFIMSSTDVFVALAILLITKTFLTLTPRASAPQCNLFSLLCVSGLLIKNDAALFIGLITLCLWIKDQRFPFRHISIIVLMLAPWLLYRSGLPNLDIGPEYMVKHFFSCLSTSHLPMLYETIMITLTKHLYLLFLFLPIAWALLIRGKNLNLIMLSISISSVSYIIIVWGIISLGMGPAVPQLMRIFTHIYPPLLMLIAIGLNPPRPIAASATR